MAGGGEVAVLRIELQGIGALAPARRGKQFSAEWRPANCRPQGYSPGVLDEVELRTSLCVSSLSCSV